MYLAFDALVEVTVGFTVSGSHAIFADRSFVEEVLEKISVSFLSVGD